MVTPRYIGWPQLPGEIRLIDLHDSGRPTARLAMGADRGDLVRPIWVQARRKANEIPDPR
jgi:hypothetical protein